MGIKFAPRVGDFPKMVYSPECNVQAADAAMHAYQKWDGAADPMHWADSRDIQFDEVLVVASKAYRLDKEEYEEVCRDVTAEMQQVAAKG